MYLCIISSSVLSITDDWSFLFKRSFQKDSIILQGKPYTCKVDIDSDGVVYAYCNDAHIGSTKSSRNDKLYHDCYPEFPSKRCDMFTIHDGDYCGNTHHTAILHLQCSSDSFEGLIGVIEETPCFYLIGIAVQCPASFFIPTFSPTFSPTLSLDDTNYTQIANLGIPVQQERRLLVGIVSCSIREPTLLKQLQSYVDICNSGWEVHVIVYTGVKVWEAPELQYIWTSSMLYCARVSRMLPVVVKYVKGCIRLAAKHRVEFNDLINNYDYFLSQEDDMAIKLQHIHYYVKWSSILDGTDYYPGFATAELPTKITAKEFSVNHRDNHLIWRSFTSSYDQDHKYFQVIMINGSAYLYYCKDWAPAYIISQKLLQYHASKPYWLGDEHQKFKNEYNPHFQHLWLAWHYKLVVPLHDYWFSWIHHTPDKYIGLSSDQMKLTENSAHESYDAFHNYYNHLPTVIEFDLFLEDCTMHKISVPNNYDVFHHKNSSRWQQSIQYSKDIKCSTCLDGSHFATVVLNFKGNYSFETRISNIEADVTCVDSFIEQYRSEYPGPGVGF